MKYLVTDRSSHNRGPILASILSVGFCLAGVSGCTLFSKQTNDGFDLVEGGSQDAVSIAERAGNATQNARVSNPPAQQIRFDGQERLLGGGSCQALPPQELRSRVKEFRSLKKDRSAMLFVQMHRRSAQRLLLTQTANRDEATSRFIASVLDHNLTSPLWRELIEECGERKEQATQWQTLVTGEKADATGDSIVDLANRFSSPLLTIEGLRLMGEMHAATDQTADAIKSLVTGAELAGKSGASSLASDLWLMACEASLRMDEVRQARRCWSAAVSSQLTSLHARTADQMPTVDSVFWEQAIRLAHPTDELPNETLLTFAPWCSRLGIQVDSLSPKAALWCAISEYQLSIGQPHLASLSLKRAETDAPPETKPLLRIALARSMAAQGQESVAATLLTGEAESKDPNLRASALAVLGAIKIQSGAYEQGGRFLGEALSIQDADQWPGQLAAKADLANLRLILGRLDDALPALHQVQNEMLASRRWQSLAQSLENEAAILELDGRNAEANAVRARMEKIERLDG